MKSNIVLFVLLFSVVAAHGQRRSDIFNKDFDITWLGIDLTKAKLIGDRERYGSESDMRRLADAWNEIFLKEPDKFNVAKAVERPSVKNAIQITIEHNQQLDILAHYSENKDDALFMKPSDVEEVVAEYDFPGMSGIGLMFVVESFAKPGAKAAVWVTFINLESKEVLLSERLMGDAGGAGLRNYWANACHDILSKVQKREYPKWKKAFSNYN